ncbi:protein AGENET DOMAIN (AGD)-CONTAINING P1-like [Solanum dulcamara]|uniref:protein AGENET DOMAIN (AGD)-CONTAINING P1-like n=1 Tax=Solanum dulcamara TaxID=45834 RepID=UPI002485F65D|nr:protein AGENET DOMAIN (AGD)-CONTAINING P1-like [Solanum dulcamara]
MAPINVTEMNSEERQQSRIAMLSKAIKSIAFKKQQITKEFQKGDEVEVAMQEYGFIGSYYTATIICSTGAYYYRIKYKNLLTDDESEPLEDVVAAAEVRPVPPHQHETISENGFRLYDMVDVFANDGWWFGFISGKIGEEYYVYFPTTADNIAYPSDVLRFHQEWSNGKWIFLPRWGRIFDFLIVSHFFVQLNQIFIITLNMAPIEVAENNSEQRHQSRMEMLSEAINSIAFKRQQITKVFQKGDEVEVASQIYGFVGSYYNATIVSSVGAYHYRVKYKTLLTDDKSAPLEEMLTAAEIRPLPPHQHETLSENGFRLYDMVDVFANDGWWFGFISGKIGEEYYVYFPTTADNIAYPCDVLRFHQEWSNGKWIFLPRQGKIFDLH